MEVLGFRVSPRWPVLPTCLTASSNSRGFYPPTHHVHLLGSFLYLSRSGCCPLPPCFTASSISPPLRVLPSPFIAHLLDSFLYLECLKLGLLLLLLSCRLVWI